MTESPGALLPSHHKILPTPDTYLDFAKDSDEQDLTEGHAHPRTALVLLLLPWCRHIFIDNSQEALTLRGKAQTGSLRHQPRMAASSREPACMRWGNSILCYSRRLQQSYPSNLYTWKSLRNRECCWSPWSSPGRLSRFTSSGWLKESSTGRACKNGLQLW